MFSSFNGAFTAGRRKSAAAAVQPVSSGLKVWYDPGDATSYSGSGSTINDISGNGYNGTVVGSPTDAGNWFTFTGTQYIKTPNLISAWVGWQHSIEIWVRPSAACVLFNDMGTSTPGSGYHASGAEIYSAGPFYLVNGMLWNGSAVTRVGGGSPSINTWFQFVRVFNGSNTAAGYINGVKSSDTTITWSTPTPQWYLGFGLGDSTAFATTSALSGSYGLIRVYNRVLTTAEVLQNYNASKSKYGL